MARRRLSTRSIERNAAEHKAKRRILRFSAATVGALVAAVLSTTAARADCINTSNNNLKYCANYAGCGQVDSKGYTPDYFWVQVSTASSPCKYGVGGDVGCYYVYATQGGKTNLSTAGDPAIYGGTNVEEHVNGYIESYEGDAHGCNDTAQAGACWVQVGWVKGWGQEPNGCGNPPPTLNTGTNLDVYVEIYDNSSAPCFLSTFGTVPANGGNASYDARYYTTLPNGQSRYEVYYEVPGSNNIQNLAYGDFNSYNTAENVIGESFDREPLGTIADCPDLGEIGQLGASVWDFAGQTVANTFARPMNLYQGGVWKNWTTSVVQTSAFNWPPVSGYHNPNVYQAVSNWSAGDYTEFKFGGPTD